jgi:hypothetical protein
MFPDSVWDQASFPFTKLTTVANSQSQYELSNTGDPFEDWLPLENFAPISFRLDPALPNPFNPTTEIRYQIPDAGIVSLQVYDTSGRLVTTLVNGWKGIGEYSVTFDGSKLSSGLYFVQMEAGAFHAVQKLALIK